MNKTAFVTGGTGFIGINLVLRLVDQGWQVTALHRPTSDLSELSPLPVSLAEGSITDLDSLRQAIPQNTEVVFHLAGDTDMWSQRNERQTAINVEGTANMVQASSEKSVQTFVHTSSVAAWGQVSGTIDEQTPQRGKDSWVNYERSKWASEQKALKGIDQGMKVVILNPAMVVGPHDTSNWGRLFFALRDGELPGVTHGNMSIAHVNEVVKAYLAAVEKGQSGHRYILGGADCTFAEFVQLIAKVSGIDRLPKTIPSPILKSVAYLQAGIAYLTGREPDLTPELAQMMTRDLSFSSEKAIRELDYTIPPVRKSVSDCYDWLRSEGLL